MATTRAAICGKITKVKPPKFRVKAFNSKGKGTIINEYELRQLMLEVAKKERPAGMTIVDEKGNSATIKENGNLSNTIAGMDIMSLATIGLIASNRRNQNDAAKAIADYAAKTPSQQVELAELHRNTRYDAIECVNETMLYFQQRHDTGKLCFYDIQTNMNALKRNIMNLRLTLPAKNNISKK